MLRAAGCLLIALGAVLLRGEMLHAPKEEIRLLRSLSMSLRRLEKDIALTLSPLPQLLKKYPQPFFASVSDGLAHGKSLSESWEEAGQMLLLSEESCASIVSLAQMLDGEESCVRTALLSAADSLAMSAECKAEELRERGRLVSTISFSTAALVCILLL